MADKVVIAENEQRALRSILEKIPHPERGLPDPVFAFALGIVPMTNVDLVVRDDEGRHLWAWREDRYGTGWHIPGSIIRLNETIAERIDATAGHELGAEIVAEASPRAILQFFNVRGAFISLVFRCRLGPDAALATIGEEQTPASGDLRWFTGMPAQPYPAHVCYERILPVMDSVDAQPPIMLTVRL